MKVGDLVKTMEWKDIEYSPKKDDEGVGIIISVQNHPLPMAHHRATVFFSKTNRQRDIAVSRLRVLK